jgi:uncharacterized protein with GYD domain
VPTFVILGRLTEDGVKTIKNLKERQETAAKIVEAAGGKITSLYYTLGRYDWVSIVEGPSIEAAMKSLFIFGSGGFNKTETLVAVSGEEAVKIAESLP